jgi:hypothetical protein
MRDFGELIDFYGLCMQFIDSIKFFRALGAIRGEAKRSPLQNMFSIFRIAVSAGVFAFGM